LVVFGQVFPSVACFGPPAVVLPPERLNEQPFGTRVSPEITPVLPRVGSGLSQGLSRFTSIPPPPHATRTRRETVEKNKALEMALGNIEKQFGKGSVMKMGDKTEMEIGTVPTGALALDLALGVGGLPRGRVVEIYGPESSGKSTLAMHVVSEAQRNGGICAYIDAEHAMDPVYARNIGVDVDELLISQPDTGEQALEIADILVRSGSIDVIVVDSVAALTPRAEIEGDMGDSHVGLQARLMSQALRKITANLNKTDTICIFINQLREKIGVMFGSPETTPGGRALKFYSSVRLDIRRIESLKDGTEAVGNRTRVKVVKNKVAPPFRQAEFDIMYGKGISREGSLLDIAVDKDIVKKSGAWYTYEGEQIGQGRENVKNFLIQNPDLVMEIQDRVLKEVGLVEDPNAEPEPAPETEAPPAKGKKAAAATAAKKKAARGDDPDDQPITLD
jgi:recombination protein RecA